MSTFTAFPVSAGDAFFLQKGEKNILVDGGKSKDEINTFLVNEGISKIDVVICTHNDEDHANGIIGLLDNNKLNIYELWLPASWTDRLLFEDVNKFNIELNNNIDELFINDNIKQPAKNVLKRKIKKMLNNISKEDVSSDNKNRKGKASVVETGKGKASVSTTGKGKAQENKQKDGIIPNKEIEDFLKLIIKGSQLNTILQMATGPIDPISIGCIKTEILTKLTILENNIKQIYEKAKRRKVIIRFFQYDGYFSINEDKYSFNGENWLFSINAHEIKSSEIKTKKYISPITYLFFTQSNRQSLMFFSPQTNNDGSNILFTADNTLPKPTLSWKFLTEYSLLFENAFKTFESFIVTAPHHGSNDIVHKYVYDTLNDLHKEKLTPIIWVRSDGPSSGKSYKSRPAKKYIQLIKKFCTRCNTLSETEFQTPKFETISGCWQEVKETLECQCKSKSTKLKVKTK